MAGEVRVHVKRDHYDFYLGRNNAMYGVPSSKSVPQFANPYSIGKDGSRAEVVGMYETYMRERLKKEPGLVEELGRLRGKRLACWCGVDQLCHVSIVIKLIGEYYP